MLEAHSTNIPATNPTGMVAEQETMAEPEGAVEAETIEAEAERTVVVRT